MALSLYKAGADADWPIVVTLDQLKLWDAAHGDCACAIYRIAKLRIGESIRELAAMALQVLEADDDDPLILQSSTAKLFTFPSDPSSLAWASTKQNEAFNTKTLIEAREVSSSVWKRFSFKKEFISLVRSCSEGRVDEGIAVRNCVYNETAMSTFMSETPYVPSSHQQSYSTCCS